MVINIRGGSKKLTTGIFNDDFHEFTINWDSEKIEWLLDGQPYYSLNITSEEMSEFHQHLFYYSEFSCWRQLAW